METILAAAILASSLASGAPADAFCEDSRILAAGAAEAEPFASLRERQFRPRLFDDYCAANGAGGYTCGLRSAAPEETAESIARRLRQCLPGSSTMFVSDGSQDHVVFTAGWLEARIFEHGSARSRAGRSIIIYFASQPPVE